MLVVDLYRFSGISPPLYQDGEQKDIQEVKNAYKAYEQIDKVNPYSVDDLKKIHGIMTYLIEEDAGKFRNHGEAVYDGDVERFMAPPQDRAEDFVYEFSGKRRPKLAYYRNGRLFDGQPYQSNFDYYGELQAPATMFARTLRGIGKEKNDMRALSMLSDRAISPNFFNNILNEYSRDGQMPSFIKEVQYMGLLKRASYANFGHSDPLYLKNSSRYLQNLGSITSQMRDYREPFTDGDRR